MRTVFQLGTAQITKDLIFGWVIGKDGDFFAITDADEQTLRELAVATLPTYLNEFKVACAAQLALLLKAEDEKEKAEAALLLFRAEEKQKRKDAMMADELIRIDAIKEITALIVDGLVETGVAELKSLHGHVYARVVKHGSDYSKAYIVTGGKSEFYGDTIAEAAAFIARRWW